MNLKAGSKVNLWPRLFAFSAAIAAIITVLAPEVFAQGCAMCYQSAAATGAQGRAALQHGILILLFPTLGIFVGIFGLIFARRNTSR